MERVLVNSSVGTCFLRGSILRVEVVENNFINSVHIVLETPPRALLVDGRISGAKEVILPKPGLVIAENPDAPDTAKSRFYRELRRLVVSSFANAPGSAWVLFDVRTSECPA